MCVQAELARDVKNELEATLRTLSGKEKGQKGKAPRGAARRKMWEDLKLLRKECVELPSTRIHATNLSTRIRH